MDTVAWISVALYMQTQIVTGFIRNPYRQRLLDILNGIFVRQSGQQGRFIELSEVTIHTADGKGERLANAYLNKCTVQLATTPDVDLSRGIGGKAGPKFSPFQDKVRVPVRLSTPAYQVIGNMYRINHQNTWHVLEDRPMFLPVTEAEIRVLTNDECAKVTFVAVNKEQILFLQEASLDQVSPKSLNLANGLLREVIFPK
jgi:hypothetical protein